MRRKRPRPRARFLRTFMVVDLRGLHNQQITKFDSRGRVVVGGIHGRPPWRPELLKQGFTEGRRLNLYATLTLLARWAKIAIYLFRRRNGQFAVMLFSVAYINS